MKGPDDKLLTVEQLEQLIELYYAGALSRAEETALRRVLAFTHLHSENIDVARAALGLEKAVGLRLRAQRRGVVWRRLAVAAAVTIVAGAGLWQISRGHDAEPRVVVYVAGERVTDSDEALRIADNSYKANIEFMQQAYEEQRRQEEAMRRMLEEMNNLP